MAKNLWKAVVLSTLLLAGCGKSTYETQKEKNLEKKAPEMVDYFDNPAIDDTLAMTAGDFNNDGNLDLIVGCEGWEDQLRYYEGDGKGNFKLRQYPAKK